MLAGWGVPSLCLLPILYLTVAYKSSDKRRFFWYNLGMSDAPPRRRKPGPVPGPETQKYNVLLEPALAEWGKKQPGGLSELVRRLLRQAYEQAKEAR